MAGTVRKNRKNLTLPENNTPNPYLIALFTAFLAGIFSVAGGYFIGGFETKQVLVQKQMEYRVSAYNSFLDNIGYSRDPLINQLLNIGSLAEHLATDTEIQDFEDSLAHLMENNDTQEIYLRLNHQVNTLRMHGSSRVSEICEDILKSLLMRDFEINWSKYPEDIAENHSKLKALQTNGLAYGYEERISTDERIMIISISTLTNALMDQLREEIYGNPIQSLPRTDRP